MLVWLTATAGWLGPIAAILNFLIAAIGLPVAVWRGRKFLLAWFGSILGTAKDASENAENAADASRSAAEHATTASKEAKTAGDEARTAGDNSRQANEAIVWLAEQVAVRDAVIEDLRERIDRLLGSRTRQLAHERVDTAATELLIPVAAADLDDPITVTGRHRLHTRAIPTGSEGDTA